MTRFKQVQKTLAKCQDKQVKYFDFPKKDKKRMKQCKLSVSLAIHRFPSRSGIPTSCL